MLQKGIAVWAKSYYYVGLGLTPPDVLPGAEQKYVNEYNKLFLEPAKELIAGDSSVVVNPGDINRLLQTIKALKLKSWLYNFNYVVRTYFKDIVVGDIKTSLQRMYSKFYKECVECLYAVQGHKSAITAFCDSSGLLKGQYPFTLLHIARIDDLDGCTSLEELANISPSKVTDSQRSALSKAVFLEILSEKDLATEVLPVKRNGDVVTEKVTALDEGLPPVGVLKFLGVMPTGIETNANQSKLHQALDILEYNTSLKKDYSEAYNWLKSNITVKTEEKCTGLTDETVDAYLFKHYGVTLKDAIDSKRPAAKELYTSSILLNEDVKEMNAADFVEMVNSEQGEETVTGTLDDLIASFCSEENISYDCTISQLIHAINYEGEVKPATFAEHAIKYKADSGVVGETTLNEVIQGLVHTPIDSTEIALDLIRSIPNVDIVFKQRFERCVMDEDASFMAEETLIALMELVDMPEDIRECFEHAVKTNSALELPTQRITDDDVKKYVSDMSDTALCEFLGRDIASTESSEPSDDIGLKANEIILKGVRKLLTEGVDGVSDDDVRTALIPICYAYLRLLMLKAGDENDAAEYLESKLSETTDFTRPYIEQAISLFKQR